MFERVIDRKQYFLLFRRDSETLIIAKINEIQEGDTFTPTED